MALLRRLVPTRLRPVARRLVVGPPPAPLPVAGSLYSAANDRRFQHWVWRPAGEGPFPLLVLLHGVIDAGATNWWQVGRAHETLHRMITAGEIPPVVLLLAADTGAGLGSGYSDWVDGTTRAETYVIRELLPWADATLPLNGRRFVSGLSMGGYAAWMLALRNPGVFESASALSAFFTARSMLEWVPDADTRIWGSAERERDHDVTVLIEDADRRRGLRLAHDCGLRDVLLDGNRSMHARLTELGVPHGYAEHDGAHDWNYWRAHLADHVRFHCGVGGPLATP